MKRLLPAGSFEETFLPLKDKRLGFLKLPGNVGDRMLAWATEQLLAEFDITYGVLNWADCGPAFDAVLPEIDTIVVAGGGNLGTRYDDCYQLRRRYFEAGLPMVILPQSITDLDETLQDYDRVFLRDRASLDLYPAGTLAPDLALGFTPPQLAVERDIDTGIFIREDGENLVGHPDCSIGDPARICASVPEYLALAARCRTIYTDRLHFAICGLIAECEVFLLPGAYHKNRSMFETSLEQLGCRWLDNPDELPPLDLKALDDRFSTLALPAPETISWQAIPYLVEGVERSSEGNDLVFVDCEQQHRITLTADAAPVIDAIDGKRSLEQVARLAGTNNQQPLIEAGRDTQYLLQVLRDNGMAGFASGASLHGTGCHRIPAGIATPEYFELQVEPPFRVGSVARSQALLRCEGSEPTRAIWFESGSLAPEDFSDRADAFVLASLLPAMSLGIPLRVKGAPVSRGLLENLYEFQLIMHAWYPHLHCIQIEAEADDVIPASSAGVAAFSGGIDSAFSILRQHFDPPACWDFDIQKAVFVRGFDIFVSSKREFDHALERARSVIKGTGCEVVDIHTNLREINIEWLSGHGVLIAAVLSLFNQKYSTGMLASTIPYKMLYPFGSNAITDRLLGSEKFRIVHDGAELMRMEKLEYLARFPGAVQNLRFCFADRSGAGNCGSCDKCVSTAILLRALDLPPDCFAAPPDSGAIARSLEKLRGRLRINQLDFHELHAALNRLRESGNRPDWYGALENLVEGVQAAAGTRTTKK